jgi:CRISPR-associated protein Cas5h
MGVVKAQKQIVLAFSVKGHLAHFRQPDTSVTHVTYPFPPKPTLLGLIGSILGINEDSPDWPEFLQQNHLLGLSILSPIHSTFVQLSLLGKGFLEAGGDDFNRPTTVELLIDPHYLIYYSGPVASSLIEFLKSGRIYYHTYLGSAYCLAFPKWRFSWESSLLIPANGETYEVLSVIPKDAVKRIYVEPDCQYASARALPLYHSGKRTFSGSRSFYYELSGQPLKVCFNSKFEEPFYMVPRPDSRFICLW